MNTKVIELIDSNKHIKDTITFFYYLFKYDIPYFLKNRK
jgi:hypothetical protein